MNKTRLTLLLSVITIMATMTYNSYGSGPPQIGATPEVTAHKNLLPVTVDKKVGYIDRSGQVIILPQYDGGTIFREGRAWVYIDGKAVLIDEENQILFRSDFNVAMPFNEGHAAVGRNVEWKTFGKPPYEINISKPPSQWGYVDRNGRVTIDMKYRYASRFSNGVAIVAIDGEENNNDVLRNTRFALIDALGHVLVPPEDRILDGEYSNDLLPASTADKDAYGQPAKWGFINKTGNWMIEPKFRRARSFHEGLAAVAIEIKNDVGKVIERWGYIDTHGRFVIAAQYDEVGDFAEGWAPVSVWTVKGYHAKYIDKSGQMVLDTEGIQGHGFAGGVAVLTLSFEPLQNCLIDRHGKKVLSSYYEYIYILEDGIISIKDHGKVQYRTIDDKLIWPTNKPQ